MSMGDTTCNAKGERCTEEHTTGARGELQKGSEIKLTKQLVIDTRRCSQTDQIFHVTSSEGEHIVKFTADY